MSETNNKRPSRLRGICAALAVVAVLLLALVVTSMIVEPKTNDSEYGLFDPATSGIRAEPADTIDVVVVGDSIALNGFAPLQTWHENGFTLFVCSTVAGKLPDGYTMLTRALERQHPKLVLIEAHPIFSEFTWDYALMSEAQTVFPVLRYHSRWRNLKAEDFTTRPQMTWHDERKGIRVEGEGVAVDQEALDNYMDDTGEVQTILPQNSLYLQRMVSLCESVGATPVIISVPSVVGWSKAHHEAMSAWANEHNVAFYDFNLVSPEEIGIDWSEDSKDGGEHFNVIGASKFSRYLAKVLKRDFDLPDHRGDKAYAEWEELYQSAD